MAILRADLPQELVEGILTGLPIKSLSRFRCVSKGFDAIISEPRFGKLQYERACTNPFDINRYEIFVLDGDDLLCLHGEASSKTFISNSEFEDVDSGFRFEDRSYVSFSSCRGLIFFSGCRVMDPPPHIFLWNSLNRHYYKVPRSNPIDNSSYGAMGFGYDYSTVDYKIVIPFRIVGEESASIQVEVFSLRNLAWRKVVAENNHDQFIFPFHFSVSVIFLKGEIFWLGSCRGHEKAMIMRFDVVKETFCLVHLPSHTRYQVHRMEMGVIGGCLCVSINEQGNGLAMWVMKDFYAAGSWTRIAFIPISILPHFYCWLKPLFVFDNGEILMLCRDNGTISIYNLKES